MINICKTYDKDIFNKFECQDGKYYNVRLREEANKRKAYSDSRRDNRKMSKSYDEHMENENKDVIRDEDDIIINVPFEKFWNEYDKKVGDKGKLTKKWFKLTDEQRIRIMDYIPRYKEAQPDKKYRKNPDTFFNQKGWEHELIYQNGNGQEQKEKIILD